MSDPALTLFDVDPDLHVSETPDGPRRTELGRWGHATVLVGDVRDRLADFPDGSVDFIVTSPPFLALRSYLPADHPDKHREIGSEPDPATFIDTLLALTADWGRVLAPWGSIAVELGDTFAGSGGAGGDYNPGGLREGQDKFDGTAYTARQDTKYPKVQRDDHRGGITNLHGKVQGGGAGWPLAKSLCGIPQAYALSLMYGRNVLNGNDSPAGRWRVRNVIVWARPNPPVGSLGKRNVDKRTGDQRFRVATSAITVACRDTGRYFDLDGVREAAVTGDRVMRQNPRDVPDGVRTGVFSSGLGFNNPAGAPPLDWHADHHPEDGDWLWKLPTAPYKGSHYATYPLTLPKRLIEAMCPRAVCTVCGWPRERVVGEAEYHRNGVPCEPDAANFDGLAERRKSRGHSVATKPTEGWTDCGHNAYRPGITLDPFLGSGTTAAAALALGRDAIGIELDTRNIDLIHQRIRETCEFGTVEVR